MKEHQKDSIPVVSFYSHNCVGKLPQYLLYDFCIKMQPIFFSHA